jgi:PleD family two-component response regulator
METSRFPPTETFLLLFPERVSNTLVTCTLFDRIRENFWRATLRVLLVEDELTAARMLAKGLREQAYAVDIVTDGEDALYRASINDYDA